MASPVCLRSFSQRTLDRSPLASLASRTLRAPQTACFSTSATRFANPNMKKKALGSAPKKGTRTLNVKKGKKASADSGKRPGIGERKAQRKRIVLTNNNALEVSSLKDLDKASALDSSIQGQVRGLPDPLVDSLRALEAFKITQGWSLFRRPATLIRKETAEVASLIKEVEASEKGKKTTVRRILTGEKMSGKSTLVLQGLSIALLRQWVVINLPECQDITNAHTDYAPLPGSQPQQYTQNSYTANLLTQILKANTDFFAKDIPVTTNPELPVPLPKGANLKQLAQLGVANPEAAWPVFMALWKELTLPNRPPILFAADNLAHIMRSSAYISPELKPIHAFDLTLVRHFVDLLSSKTALPNGGVILAATSKSNAPATPALDFSVQIAEAKQYHPESMPRWNPYKNIDGRVMEALKDIPVIKSGGLSKEEARSVMEYYAESGMLRAKVDEQFVSQKWSLAGMGNVGELERATVRLRI